MDEAVAPIDRMGKMGGSGGGDGVERVEPQVAVAGCYVVGGIVGGMNGEMEGIDAAAPEGIAVSVGVDSRGGEQLSVPEIAVAGLLVDTCVGAVVDGEVEMDDAVASHSIGQYHPRGGVVPIVNLAVDPLEAVAGGDDIGGVAAVVHGEVEGDDTVAALVVEQVDDRRGGAGGVGVAIPGVAVAGGLDVDAGAAVVEGEVEGDHAVAPLAVEEGVLCGIVIVGIGYSVNPEETVAGHLVIDASVAVVDGEVERDDAVAPLSIAGEVGGLGGAGGVGDTVPGEAVADGMGLDAEVAVAYGEME